jgi:hypothetical protein
MYGNYILNISQSPLSTQRGRAATKKAFNPQISQITRIFKMINKNNS